jgi:AcrR family transcriptional regulator
MERSEPIRSTYHHGHLREALVRAAIELLEEGGPDRISVAEAAKRAGVSSGAPFRHFASKTHLMTAVAEALQAALLNRMQTALLGGSEQPWDRLQALGRAYLAWGLECPTHFRTFSNRNLYHFESSEILREGDERIVSVTEDTFQLLLPDGPQRQEEARRLNIHARALLTGLVTMYCNGHFHRLGIQGESPEDTMFKTWEAFVASLQVWIGSGSLSSASPSSSAPEA